MYMSWSLVVVELVTDKGITGIGEAGVGFGTSCNAAEAQMADRSPKHQVLVSR